MAGGSSSPVIAAVACSASCRAGRAAEHGQVGSDAAAGQPQAGAGQRRHGRPARAAQPPSPAGSTGAGWGWPVRAASAAASGRPGWREPERDGRQAEPEARPQHQHRGHDWAPRAGGRGRRAG